jgi:hypothetical protein
MTSQQSISYFSANVCRDLRQSVERNLDRYLSSGFEDRAGEPDWSIKLGSLFDLAPLKQLATTVKDDTKSSMLVWKTLGKLAPSLAMEGRVWTRLAHIECIEYARSRWIGERTGEDAIKVIEDHFFAETRTACRDDNAVGRLWWTAYVAYLAMPQDQEKALVAIWKSADIRSNIVERPWISSRPKLAGAIVRAVLNVPAVTATEAAFRDFMKGLNRQGGGLLFEVMTDAEVDAFVGSCVP